MTLHAFFCTFSSCCC
ncbi:hypothetical protein E2C01_088645 [Portunus trituberculatus]|uniref:Uncharacterized protein n=1 Tax=Portunus trituberculatus TaxID=210409 RepID=A0A5B7JGL1_PORTR|nr:hypothetical protein [Portunus trituberculatus]